LENGLPIGAETGTIIAGGSSFSRERTDEIMLADKARRGHDHVAPTIRKKIGTSENRRQLRRLPVFKPVEELPAHLRELLDYLQRNECEAAPQPER
jgi:hypothetical protein